MTLRLGQVDRRMGNAGFTLIEILISFVVFTLAIAGLIEGYVQANRMAEWSSMSLAAQSYAEQSLEQARSAQWNYEQYPYTSGPGSGDELPPTTNSAGALTNIITLDTNDVPTSGAPILITNYLSVATVATAGGVPLRQIRSDVVWTFPLDGVVCTNTAITQRAPDQ